MTVSIAFIDGCRFFPTAGGTADWTYSSTVTGFQSPTLANAANSAVYAFRAQSGDQTQWEITTGAYNSGTGVFARTTVLYNSSGTGSAAGQSGAGTKISFSAIPQVAIITLAEVMVSQQIGQLPGTATNDSASAGNVGEFLTASLVSGSALTLTTATAVTVISKSLTAGDWDVSGVVAFSPGGSTTTIVFLAGINTTTNVLPGVDSGQQSGTAFGVGVVAGGTSYEPTPIVRISLSTSGTVFLVAQANFSGSTMNAWGTIRCRRVR